MFDNLDAVRDDIINRLSHGANRRHGAMHTPVVATADADARVMVLRAFDPATWTVRFHTDARSPKVAMIGDGAHVGVLFYDREAKVQIRCRGTGWIEREGRVADEAWAASTLFARRCYLGEGPGTSADKPTSGLPVQFEGIEPEEQDLIVARENFAVLLVRFDTVDWFHLANTGHRRAVFEQGAGRWVTP